MNSSSETFVAGLAQRGIRGQRPVRWELDDLETAAASAGEMEPDEPVNLRDEAEWEREMALAFAAGLEEGRRQGLEAGREEGRALGIEEGRSEEADRLRSALQAIEGAFQEIRSAEAIHLRVMEENLAALAVAVARQIIGREVQGDAGAVAENVRRALVEFPLDQPLRVRLSPHDLSLISSYPTATGEKISIAPGRELYWLADPLLEPGSYLVEGKERLVDGRVDRALERIYRGLIDA